MIFSIELEQQLLSALIQYPEKFHEISEFISYSDFYSEDSKVHSTIFSVLAKCLENKEPIDPVVLADRIKNLGISFSDNLSIGDYIQSLSMRRIPPNTILSIARDLKLYTVRRNIYNAAKDVAKSVKSCKHTSYIDVVAESDSIFNECINSFESAERPVNIYEEMEAVVEERGNNPITEFGFMGPFPKVNSLYGSLLRPGNISVIVARSACGKTALAMRYATYVTDKYSIPVLHFDNGEMSKEELIMRQCAAISDVPHFLLETGQWRKAGNETVAKVRSVWNRVKGFQFYYYNVGGMSVDAMVQALKRFYYGRVGRGNKMVFSFDYIKTTFERGDKEEWRIVGEMVDKFKKAIAKDLVIDGHPMVAMITSVQSNRAGITRNRDSSSVIDDESIVSLSDRIIQFCSHMAILRHKTHDEILEEGDQFGTHRLIFIKHRHLGRDVQGALEPVRIGGALRQNSVNLRFENFNIEECGDLRDVAAFLEAQATLNNNTDNDLPDLSQSTDGQNNAD